MPENPASPHGNYNPLERVIKAASNATSYSWCTCRRGGRGGRVLGTQQQRAPRQCGPACPPPTPVPRRSEEICEQQLGGRVAWNQQVLGHSGYLPRVGGATLRFNARTGLPASQLRR